MDEIYGPVETDADVERAAEILNWSFGAALTWDSAKWLAATGHETARALWRNEGMAAVLCVLPMGQWFGGRRVPSGGISGVGTAAEARGQGASTALLIHTLRELRADGVPLSTLYPASYTLYRRSGYEIAGSRFRYRVAARDIDVRDRELAVSPLGERHHDAVAALRDEVARHQAGNLDRGRQGWDRARSRRGKAATGFGVWDGDTLEGYVYMLQTPTTDHPGPYDLELIDVQARSARGWRRLLTLLRDHGSLSARVGWWGGPAEPMALMLAEEVCEVSASTPWMLRLVDVDRALEARGWGRAPVTLELEVHDPVLPENSGRRVLTVCEGAARVRPGGAGALRLDIRALAQLYTGYASASQLTRMGRVDGDGEAIARADALFSGPHPWMSDMF